MLIAKCDDLLCFVAFMMLYAIKNYPADQLDGEEAIPQRLDESASRV